MSIREQAFQALATTISSLAPTLRRPALRIVDMAKEVDGYRLCVGNWSPWHIQQMDKAYVLERKQAEDVLWAVHHPLALMVGDLWDERTRLRSIQRLPPVLRPLPLLARTKFYAVTTGPAKGIHISFQPGRMSGHPYSKFSSRAAAEAFLTSTASSPEFVVDLAAHTQPTERWVYTDGSYYPASQSTPKCAGWSNVIQAGDSDLLLVQRRDMLLPMNELTDDGKDMKLSNITGELQALQQAVRWFNSMPDDEYNSLTSIVILSTVCGHYVR